MCVILMNMIYIYPFCADECYFIFDIWTNKVVIKFFESSPLNIKTKLHQ